MLNIYMARIEVLRKHIIIGNGNICKDDDPDIAYQSTISTQAFIGLMQSKTPEKASKMPSVSYGKYFYL